VSRVGIVVAALATLGLSLALMISPAIAHHDTPNPEVTPTIVAGNPSCPTGTTEIKFEDDANEVETGEQKQTTIGSTTVRVEILETDGMYVTFDVDNAVAAHVLVEGGDNANNYDYSARSDGGIRHDDHLIAPDNGGGQQPAISHISFCLVLPPASGTATATATIPNADDHASLNIRKNDQDGHRLPGAVFTVDGIDGTFTSDENGMFCILGLPEDSVWQVTEIKAPPGYEIGQPASQMVEVDNDGDCNSPDAVFTNSLSASTATPTPEGSVAGGTSTPTPEGSVQGGTGTPAPSQPDTAMGGTPGPSPVPTFAFAIVLLASIGTLAYANVRSTRHTR
jgi:hypothetical protein